MATVKILRPSEPLSLRWDAFKALKGQAFNVVDPERAVIRVQRYLPATVMLAQTTLRAVLGQHELDEMLSERKKLSADVQPASVVTNSAGRVPLGTDAEAGA